MCGIFCSTYVDIGGVLVYTCEALFSKEFCVLLTRLEAASPRYDNDITYVLAGKAWEDIIKKVSEQKKRERRSKKKFDSCLINEPSLSCPFCGFSLRHGAPGIS
jgi:hypothetical protein